MSLFKTLVATPAVRLRAYHITITLPGGTQRVHEDMYRDSAAAASHTADLFPQAERMLVRRLSTFLRIGGRASGMPCIGRSA